MGVLVGKFDVNIVTNFVCGVDDWRTSVNAYLMVEYKDGTVVTDKENPIVAVKVSSFDCIEDVWISGTDPELDEAVKRLPPLIREIYASVVTMATKVQDESYKVAETP